MVHIDVEHRSTTAEFDRPFVAAVRIDGQNEVFGFKTPKERDAFVADLKDRDDLEWATGHHPDAAVAFVRGLLRRGDAKAFVDALPTNPDGLFGDLLRESVAGERNEHAEKSNLALATLRRAAHIADSSELGSLIRDIMDS